jgi:Uma2 family endonuclease
MSTQIEPILTVEDLDLFPDDGNRYELIEGELFVSRAPRLFHQVVVGNAFSEIRNFLDNHPLGLVVYGPGVIFSQFSGVIPDVVFITNEQRGDIASGDKITGAPSLVIEVLSPGVENERRDRIAKRALYAKYGVKEYWIIDCESRAIEVYVLEAQTLKFAAVFKETDEITSSVLPGFHCKVAAIFSI